jgi:hypothetical protein
MLTADQFRESVSEVKKVGSEVEERPFLILRKNDVAIKVIRFN